MHAEYAFYFGGIVLVAILVFTYRFHPWSRVFGSPGWDASSFATNFAGLTMVLGTLQAMTSANKKNEAALALVLFALLAALAPMFAAVWRTSATTVNFGGVVSSVLASSIAAFGQLQVMLTLAEGLPGGWTCTSGNACPADFFIATLQIGQLALAIYSVRSVVLISRAAAEVPIPAPPAPLSEPARSSPLMRTLPLTVWLLAKVMGPVKV